MLHANVLQILKSEQVRWQLRAIDTDPSLHSVKASAQLEVAAMFGAATLAATPILSNKGEQK
jgi:hypothetical protein